MIATRGREFIGTVINAKMQKTATVEWPRQVHVPKYERYLSKRTRVKAHNAINAVFGDKVRVRECRKISKTKSFMIVENLGTDYAFMARAENLKQGLAARSEKPKEHPKEEGAEE